MIGPEEKAAITILAPILNNLPAAIATERRRRGLSQEATAEQIGVDRQSVNRWERSRGAPGGPQLVAVLHWLAAP